MKKSALESDLKPANNIAGQLSDPWLINPEIKDFHPEGQQKEGIIDVIVVGAGIAGASTAYTLAEAGMRVLVLEKAEMPATKGSGNLQGMLYLKLSPSLTYQNDLLTMGFERTLEILQTLTDVGLLIKGEDWDDCGLIQLSQSVKQAENQKKLAATYPPSLLYVIDQIQASEIAGVALTAGGLHFPRSGWVAPQALVNALLQHENITLQVDSNVTALHQCAPSGSALWRVDIEGQSSLFAKIVVLAMADQVRQLSQCTEIPFTVVRGQTTTAPGDNMLKTVISGEGYMAPSKMISGEIKSTFGATFHRDQPGGAPTDSEHLENIEMLAMSAPSLLEKLGLSAMTAQGDFHTLTGRASTRASAMGSLPVVGPIANRVLFLERFKAIRLDAKAIPDEEVPWEYGLYLSTAHGSRGMISAPISAMILRDYIMGDTDLSRYPAALLAAIHPNRFYYRELRFDL